MTDTDLSKIDLSSMDISELKELQNNVAKAMHTYEARQKKEALEAARAVAAAAGFKLDDLIGGSSKKSGSVSPAKFKNPDNPSQTWTGKGRRPKWYAEQLEKGTRVEDMEIS